VDNEQPERRGITRRDVIKGGVVIGGVAWAAPVVDSFVAPAFAAGSVTCGAVTICRYHTCGLCSGGFQTCSTDSTDFQLSCTPAVVNGQCSPVAFASCCCSAGNCGPTGAGLIGVSPCSGSTPTFDSVCPYGDVRCS
jgi:hypothetical protein